MRVSSVISRSPSYDSIRRYIAKRGYPNSGKIARFLLEKFVSDDSRIVADMLYDAKICSRQKGTNFTTWRDDMVAMQVLSYEERPSFNHSTYEYFPGLAIREAVNQEKIRRKNLLTHEAALLQFAEKEDVAALAQKIDEKVDHSHFEEKIIEQTRIIQDLQEKYQAYQKLLEQYKANMESQQEVIQEHQEMFMQQSEIMEETTARLERMEKALQTFVKKYLEKNPPDTPERRHLLISAMEQGMDFIPSDMKN